MTSPTLSFSKNFSLGQRARAMARYAAAVRLLQADPANIARIHGTMARWWKRSSHLWESWMSDRVDNDELENGR